MSDVNQYQKTTVNTATPMELVVMVYDECISTLLRAEAAFEIEGPERIEKVGNNLLHAQDCITELALSLDMEKGGEISGNLSRIYDFMTRHLSQANVNKSLEPIVEVREMMEGLRESWQQVAAQAPTTDQSVEQPKSRSGRINLAG